MHFTPEQDQYLQLAQTRAYYEGLRDGVQRYAHWHDGIQYVGSTGQTLMQALMNINAEEQNVLDRYKKLLETFSNKGI